MASPSPAMVDSARSERIALALGLLAAVAVFLPTLGFGFVNWDDDLHLLGNRLIVGQTAWWEHLSTPTLPYPVPVTMASYRLEHALVGLEPWLYHATNVVIHTLSCLLVFRIGRALGLGVAGAAVALVVFGLHPVAAEPVSWVTGRKDLLAVLFSLWATLLLVREGAMVAGRWNWRLLGLFVLAILSKPVALFLLAVIPLWHLVLRRDSVRAAARTLLVPLALAAPVILSTLGGESEVGSLRPLTTVAGRVRELWYGFGYHLGLLAGVQAPCVKHIPLSMPPAFDAAVDLMPLPWLLVLAVLGWRWRERRRLVAAASGFLVLAYIPSSGLIGAHTRFLADTFVYPSLAGLAWIVGAVVDVASARLWSAGCRADPRSRSRLAWCSGRLWLPAAATTLAVLPLAPVTVAYSAHWRDGVALWSHAFARYPDSPHVCRALGNAYGETQGLERALETYRLCQARFGSMLMRKNIAVTLTRLGRFDEARREFELAARERPGDPVIERYRQQLRRMP